MNRKYLGMITICFMILNMCGCQSTIGTNIKPPTDQTYGKNQSFTEKTDNEKQIDDSQTTEEIIYDDFSIQIDDINKLLNNEIDGFIFFGRDTCPFCLNLNKFIKEEFENNEDLVVNKFDTDTWRKNENFQSVLDKYGVKKIPVLIKINADKTYITFESENVTSSEVQSALNKFLNECPA